MDFDLTGLFSAAGAIAGGAAVATLVQVVKGIVFPAHWQTGRAPMVAASVFAALLVIAAEQVATRAIDGAVLVTDVLTWATVYTAAIGTHQTIAKVGRIASDSTNPTGPDAG